MGAVDKAKNKAQDLKGKAKESTGKSLEHLSSSPPIGPRFEYLAEKFAMAGCHDAEAKTQARTAAYSSTAQSRPR